MDGPDPGESLGSGFFLPATRGLASPREGDGGEDGQSDNDREKDHSAAKHARLLVLLVAMTSHRLSAVSPDG
jgi:hypothetical protein